MTAPHPAMVTQLTLWRLMLTVGLLAFAMVGEGRLILGVLAYVGYPLVCLRLHVNGALKRIERNTPNLRRMMDFALFALIPGFFALFLVPGPMDHAPRHSPVELVVRAIGWFPVILCAIVFILLPYRLTFSEFID